MHIKIIRCASGGRRSSNLKWEPRVRRGSGICISATTLVSLTRLQFEHCHRAHWVKICTLRGNWTQERLCTHLEFSTAVKYTLLGKQVKIPLALLSFWKGQGTNLWSFTSQGLEAVRRKSSKTRMPVPGHYIQVPNSPTIDGSTPQAIIQPCTSFPLLFFFLISLLAWPHLAIPCSFSSLAHLHRDYCNFISLTSPQNCFPFDECISSHS